MTFTIDNIRSDDVAMQRRAVTYLRKNPHPGVRLRPKEQLDRAMHTGQGLVVLRGGEICGISLVYQFDLVPVAGVHYEIGSMRITAAGLGMQVLLAQLHLLQISLEDDRTRDSVFAVVRPGSESEHNLTQHVGMTSWRPPRQLADARAAAGVAFDSAKRTLIATDAAIGRAFSGLRAGHVEQTRFLTRKQSQLVDVRLGWLDPKLLYLL